MKTQHNQKPKVNKYKSFQKRIFRTLSSLPSSLPSLLYLVFFFCEPHSCCLNPHSVSFLVNPRLQLSFRNLLATTSTPNCLHYQACILRTQNNILNRIGVSFEHHTELDSQCEMNGMLKGKLRYRENSCSRAGRGSGQEGRNSFPFLGEHMGHFQSEKMLGLAARK